MKRRKINRLLLSKSMLHLGGMMPYLKMMACGFFLSMQVISIQAQIVPAPTTYFDLTGVESGLRNGAFGFHSTISNNRFAQFLTSKKNLVMNLTIQPLCDMI
jgi:hypothetical protein